MDQLVFKKVRAAMGGRVRFIVSGGAPLAPHDEDFARVALGPLLQVRPGAGPVEPCCWAAELGCVAVSTLPSFAACK